MRLALGAPTALGALIFFGALALGRLDTSYVLGPVSVTPLLAAIAAALGSVAGRMPRSGSGRRSATGRWPPPPDRAARLAPWSRRRAPPDRLAATWLGVRAAARVGDAEPDRDPARDLRRELPAVGRDREPPALGRLPGRSYRPDARPAHRGDVRLPQLPDVAAPGLVAVVGVAVRPQAGVVLPGRVRGRRRARRSTTPATS